MYKYKIEKPEGTIAYIEGLEIEQINTADFIIFRIEDELGVPEIQRIISGLKSQGCKKTFLILPKHIEYCVFKKESK